MLFLWRSGKHQSSPACFTCHSVNWWLWSNVVTPYGASFLCLGNGLANEGRRYLCNVFSYWLRPCSRHVIRQNKEYQNVFHEIWGIGNVNCAVNGIHFRLTNECPWESFGVLETQNVSAHGVIIMYVIYASSGRSLRRLRMAVGCFELNQWNFRWNYLWCAKSHAFSFIKKSYRRRKSMYYIDIKRSITKLMPLNISCVGHFIVL